MPLRMLIDSDTVAAEDVALVGARSLDPPEETFIVESGLRFGEAGVAQALEGVDAVYVAFDCDVLEPDCGVSMFMPEPGGMTPEAAEAVLVELARHTPVAGLGFSGLAADPQNVAGLARFCRAVGL
jgi:arginase family enzyme